ncbi:DUF676-domain-containing protein [Clavulina sp. PMI_390]|nr:DUF676-domain-containing protein [Clavulina sp. PMI_390]
MEDSDTLTHPRKVHFLILCHGMWGNLAHLQAMKDTMSERFLKLSTSSESGDAYEYIVHAAESNQDQNTYDGIDWGGERIIKEIHEQIRAIEEPSSSSSSSRQRVVTRFSITGYSLGGLLARYVVGALHAQGFFERVEPVNLNTIATPHLGVPRYPGFFSGVAGMVGPRLLGRTGQQFYHVDKWSEDGRSLLEIMADPESVFYTALMRFRNVTIFANTVNDGTVPYMSAAIETEDPFLGRAKSGLTVEFDPTYSPIITSYSTPGTPPPRPAPPPASFPYIKIQKPFIPPLLRSPKRPWLEWVMVAAMPVLMPVIWSMLLTRLTIASHGSNKRIKILEEEVKQEAEKGLSDAGSESTKKRLKDAWRKIEETTSREAQNLAGNEDDVGEGDILEQVAAGPSLAPSPASTDASAPLSAASVSTPTPATSSKTPYPRLSKAQLQMAAHLNSFPHLKKKLVYIVGPPLYPAPSSFMDGNNDEPTPKRSDPFNETRANAHAVIVARDLVRFGEYHIAGLGVLKCWRDEFVL